MSTKTVGHTKRGGKQLPLDYFGSLNVVDSRWASTVRNVLCGGVHDVGAVHNSDITQKGDVTQNIDTNVGEYVLPEWFKYSKLIKCLQKCSAAHSTGQVTLSCSHLPDGVHVYGWHDVPGDLLHKFDQVIKEQLECRNPWTAAAMSSLSGGVLHVTSSYRGGKVHCNLPTGHSCMLVIVESTHTVSLEQIFAENAGTENAATVGTEGAGSGTENAATKIMHCDTHLELCQGACVMHYVGYKSACSSSYNLTRVFVHLEQNASYQRYMLDMGRAEVFEDITAMLVGRHAEANFYGMSMADKQSSSQHALCVIHDADHTSSNQYYKGIYDGASVGALWSRICVKRGCKQVEAHQKVLSVLQSQQARAYALPCLDINTDDIVCTHGAGIGGFPSDVLFYGLSRGMTSEQVVRMFVAGMIRDIYKLGEQKDFLRNMLSNDWMEVIE